MISGLIGQILDRDEESLHVEVHGVGYKVHVPQGLLAGYAIGSQIRLKIHTHVREDQITLFGFESKTQMQLFHSLLKVNGVGPKVALGILSSTRSEEFRSMIINKDIKALGQLPKVGKKTAEQILLKLGDLDWSKRETLHMEALDPEFQKLKLALMNLGFPLGEVQEVLANTDLTQSFETNFKKSLFQLSQV